MISKDEVKRTGETGVEETILEGHLGVTKELLAFQTPEKKYYIGSEKGGANLIKVPLHTTVFKNVVPLYITVCVSLNFFRALLHAFLNFILF